MLNDPLVAVKTVLLAGKKLNQLQISARMQHSQT
jgi:hypothetical protein